MFVDARSLEPDTRLHYDLCIIGGGAAGITVAHELRSAGFRTCLLEAGAQTLESRTQRLYAGAVSDRWYPDIDTSRLRFFGGTTNHWTGSSQRLSEIDFERRDWVPHSGWPITLAELETYYIQAHGYCQLVDTEVDPVVWQQRSGLSPVPLDDSLFGIGIAYSSPPTVFGEVYGPALERAPDVDVYLNANVVEIVAAADGLKIISVQAAVLEGRRFTVAARAFVLAAGGIENARLLLLSDGVHRGGLGNGHGLVGRCFMDHPVVTGAVLQASGPRDAFAGYLGPSRPARGVGAHLELTAAALRTRRLNNMRLPFVEVSRYRAAAGIDSYHELQRAMGDAELQGSLWDHIGNVVSDFDMVLEATARRLFGMRLFDRADERGYYLFDAMLEQTPDPENRVALSDRRDALGQRQVVLHWRLSEADKANAWKVFELLGREFARTGLGRVRLLKDQARIWEDQLSYGSHHMGTTRMSDDPQTGVVDANQKVHDVFNLFVAGSSVFPTGGHVPPTLTIVALSIRLADHLRTWMRS